MIHVAITCLFVGAACFQVAGFVRMIQAARHRGDVFPGWLLVAIGWLIAVAGQIAAALTGE